MMNLNDLKKLFTGPVLINLDRIITPRLLTLFYLMGLAGIGLWGMNHLFFSFRFGLGNGLWGVLEIGVFGTMAFIVLRGVCEMALVFFETHKDVVARHAQTRHLSASPNLIEDVREAIEYLAREEVEQSELDPSTSQPIAAKTSQASKASPQRTSRRQPKASTSKSPPKRAAPRRTAKRAPKTTRS